MSIFCRQQALIYLALLTFSPSHLLALDDRLFELSLDELLKVKASISTGQELSINESPASISIYSRVEIERMGITTLEQLLNLVPGIQVARTDTEGIAQTPSVRGRRTNDVGREILVLIDGLRLNDVVTGGVFSQDKGISLQNIHQVEVMRGPGSALYGANAFSAVINIKTNADDQFLSYKTGNYSAKEGQLQIVRKINELKLSLFAHYYDDSGENYPAFFNFQGQYEPTQDPVTRQDLYLQTQYKGFNAYYRRVDRRYGDFVNGGAQALDYQRHKTDNQSLRLTYQHNWSKLNLNAFIEASENEADNTIGLFPASPQPDPTGGPLYWSNGSQQLMIGGNIRTVNHTRYGLNISWLATEQHTVSGGISWLNEEVGLNPFQSNIDINKLQTTGEIIPISPGNDLQEGFYIGGVRFDLLEPEKRKSYGVYLQDEWSIFNAIHLTFGIRHDSYDDFGDNTSLRGGLTYTYSNHNFKLLYGEAFRAPSFIETRAGIASGGISNPDLDPEKVQTLELSWNAYWSFAQSTVTFFNNQFHDVITPVLVDDVVPGLTALQPQNSGEERINGVEIELDADINQNISLRGGLTHLLDSITESPAPTETLYFITNFSYGKLNTNLQSRYSSKIFSRSAESQNTQQDIYLKSYWHFDLSLNYILFPQLNTSLTITNIFNQNHQSYSPQSGLEKGLPSRGRQLMAGLKYRF